MNLYRKKLMDKPDDFLKLTERLERDGRFQDMSARYKRPKPGGTPELDHWYQLKNCFFQQQIPVGEEPLIRAARTAGGFPSGHWSLCITISASWSRSRERAQ